MPTSQETRATSGSASSLRRHTSLDAPPGLCKACWEGPFAEHLGLSLVGLPSRQTLFLERLQRTVPTQGSYLYTRSWADVEAGTGTGCLWCAFILAMCKELRANTGSDGVRPIDSEEDLRITLSEGLSGPRTFVGRIQNSPENVQGLRILVNAEPLVEAYVYAEAGNPVAAHIVARKPIADVGSPRALALAKECITECMHSHPHCKALTSPDDGDGDHPFLPTHLIDCTEPDRPRLASTLGRRGRYLTLSYVWGESQPHSTTTSNLRTYECDGILAGHAASLPATIRDAIHVTHALGVQYLWVDTLCIIQDSEQDKRHELAQMHRIYRDAYVTIIAASAAKVSAGFLQERPAASRTKAFDIALPFPCPTTTPGAPVITEDLTAWGEVHLAPIHNFVKKKRIEQYSHASEPISARGWCMQEYMMSLRSLIFTSETLQFRCQRGTQNVGKSFYNPSGEPRLPDILFAPRLSESRALDHGSHGWSDVHTAWLRVVEDYTRRTISFPWDKLVACGAIAEAFQHVLRSDYLAGLWRDTLSCDLLWHKEDGAHLSRPAAYRAPSWSWAAVDGRVTTPRGGAMPQPEYLPAVEVLQCETALEHPAAPFGQVIGATLILRGVLLPCMLESPWDSSFGNCQVLLQPLEHIQGWGLAGGGMGFNDRGWVTMPVGWAYIDVDTDLEIQRAWAIPLEQSDWAVEGLVLVPLDGTGREQSNSKVYQWG